MRAIKLIVGGALVALATTALGAPQTMRLDEGEQIKKSVLSGEESRIGAFNNILTDCSSAPLPAVRIVKAPAKGTVRFNPTRIAIDRRPGTPRAHCNGMQAEALGVYYNAPEGFSGVEQMTIDADWRDGKIIRYLYTISVR